MTFQMMQGRWSRRAHYARLLLHNLRSPGCSAVAVSPAVKLNPYLSLIYAAWTQPALGTDITTAARLVKWRLVCGVHLHWDEFIFPFARPATTYASQSAIASIRNHGGRIAFTIHNHLPHSDLNNTDAISHFRQWRQYLLSQADAVHVHSNAAYDVIMSEYDIAAERLHVVSHPSYASIFSPAPRPFVPATRRRFLCFGTIRQNKGIPNLLAAFQQISVSERNIELRLAGRGVEKFVGADLGPNRLILSRDFIPDADVPALFADTEFCVFGFDSALTSGSLMLALTLGKPVIVPRFASLMEVFEDGPAPLSYTPGDVAELTAVLTRAAAMQEDEIAALADQSFAIAARYDPEHISRALQAVVCGD